MSFVEQVLKMNRVNQSTPLAEVVELFRRDGYVFMEDALSPAQVATLREAYDEQLAMQESPPGAVRAEVPRILERGAVFEELMDHASVFRVARAIIGADIELASGGELDHKYPHTPAHIGWHNDFLWMRNVPYPRQNFWIRCTYFLSDVSADGGPFTLLPGSHLKEHACPEELQGVDESGQPVHVEGQIGITGRAGGCLINNTEIWHTNTPNNSDEARRLIMILYKHAWMKQWGDGYATSPEFAARQSDELRRQLCGCYDWHYDSTHFPANDYGKNF